MRSKFAAGVLVGSLALFGAACEEGSDDVEDVTPETEEGPATEQPGLDTEDVTPELDESTSTTS